MIVLIGLCSTKISLSNQNIHINDYLSLFYRIYFYNMSFLPGISLEELTLNIKKQFENKNGLYRILAR